MRTEDEIQRRLIEVKSEINKELGIGTNDPIKQWTVLKVLQSEKLALEWVLGSQEVS